MGQFNDCCHDMQYQCYNGEELCPSTKCYTQNTQWVSGDTDIQCAMTNSACLENTCSMSGMVVKLDVELFHTNGQDAAAFVDQLTNGTRDLSMNGTPLANGSCLHLATPLPSRSTTPTTTSPQPCLRRMAKTSSTTVFNSRQTETPQVSKPSSSTSTPRSRPSASPPPTSWSRLMDSGSTRRTSKWPWAAMAISPQTSTADFTPTKTVTTKSCRTTSSTWARCSMVWSMLTNSTASASS